MPVIDVDRQDRRFVQTAQVVSVAPHIREHPRGFIRITERWNFRAIQNRNPGIHIFAAHPAGKERFAGRMRVLFEMLGSFGGVGHCLRCENHEHPVRVRVLRRNLQRFGVPLRARVSQNVDWIIVTPLRR